MHIFHNATEEKLVQRFNYVSHFQWQFSSLNRLISSRDPLPPGESQHTLGREGALKCSCVSLSSQPGSSPCSSPDCRFSHVLPCPRQAHLGTWPQMREQSTDLLRGLCLWTWEAEVLACIPLHKFRARPLCHPRRGNLPR